MSSPKKSWSRWSRSFEGSFTMCVKKVGERFVTSFNIGGEDDDQGAVPADQKADAEEHRALPRELQAAEEAGALQITEEDGEKKGKDAKA